MAEATDKTAAATDRRGLSLRVLIFMLCAGLVVLVVIASVGISILQGRTVADEAIAEAVSRSQATQSYFERLRYRQLELITQLIADDANLRSYIGSALTGGDDLFGDAAPTIDEASITDLLDERRAGIGFDVALLLDTEGMLVSHTGRPVGDSQYFDDEPLVQRLIDDLLPVTGLWQEAGELYQVAMVPLTERLNLIGFLIAGLRVDAGLIDEVKAATGMEQVLYTGSSVYASTLPAVETDALTRALWAGGADAVASELEAGGPVIREITLGGRPWVASLRPLDAGGGLSVVDVSVVAVDSLLTGYRAMQRTMVAVGAAMVLVGLLASLLLARRVSQPLSRMADAAQAASEGDYDRRLEAGGTQEVARLGHALDSLLSDLRERRDMEEFVTDLSRFLPEPGSEVSQFKTGSETVTRAPRHHLAALLGMDFRAAAHDPGDARAHVQEMERRLAIVEACARRCDGRIDAVMGQRVLVSFDGEDAPLEALACTGELARAELPLPPMALVSGEVDRGSVRTGDLRVGVVLGKPSQQLDLLLEEAAPGQLLLSPAVKQVLSEALDEPVPHVVSGRLSGRRYYVLGPGQIAALPGPDEDQGTVQYERTGPDMAAGRAKAGDVFADRFEILAILGSGGMGMVYKALDRELDDFVALKTLLPEIASDTRYLESLKEELKVARRVTHANVLRTYDFGTYEGTAYISMEYVRGMTLRYLLRQRPDLPYSAGLRIARQLCSGLAAAHEQGVIHRDIKPENVILESAGNAKLMDFGIARPVAKLATDEAESVFAGTPLYAAPEQMEGKAVDASADVFAAGVLMYEMFTGHRPYQADDLVGIYRAKQESVDPSPREAWPEMPEALEAIILTCLAPDKAHRYPSAAELGRALARLRA